MPPSTAAALGRRVLPYLLSLLLMAAAPAFAQTIIRVNAGGSPYTDTAGKVWSADTGFNTGTASSSATPVSGTLDQPLYQTNRFDPPSAPELEYTFAVPNGLYQVNLGFAEAYSGAFSVGARKFNVQMEGATVLQNLDIYAEAGANTVLIKTVVVNVADGQLNIRFVHVVENPLIRTIEILTSQVPTNPTGLTATQASVSQINLSWTAAIDNVAVASYQVERCQGTNCSNFARIAGPTGTSYADSGLSASTTYRYRVRAVNGAGNVGAYSAIATSATASSAPFTPIRVNSGGSAYTDAASNVWSADTGFNTGTVSTTTTTIAGTSDQPLYRTQRYDSAGGVELQYSFTVPNGSYQVNLGFAEIWSGAYVVGGRVFSVQLEGVTAFANLDIFAEAGATTALMKTATTTVADGQLNIGFMHGPADNPAVNAIEIQRLSPPDAAAPSAPSGLVATPISDTQVDLTWNAASDNVAVTGYRVERCQAAGCTDFAELVAPSGTTFSDTGVVASTTYRYRVRAADAAGNVSGYSAPVFVTTSGPTDSQPPTSPTGLGAIASSSTQVQLSWTASTDDVHVVNYAVERCAGLGCSSFAQVGTAAGTTHIDGGVTGSAIYNYRVRAADATPNYSGYSNVAMVTTPSATDVQLPSAPAGLGASAVSGREIALAWTAATDDVAISRYLIERCQGTACSSFSPIGTTLATSYNDTALATSATYRYRVRAVDTANNVGSYSSIATATTTALGGEAGNVIYEYDSSGRLKRVTVTPQ